MEFKIKRYEVLAEKFITNPLLVWLPIQLYWNILIFSFLLRYRASHKAQGVTKCCSRQHTPGQLLTLCCTSSHWPLELLLAPLCKVLHKGKLFLIQRQKHPKIGVVTWSRNFSQYWNTWHYRQATGWCQGSCHLEILLAFYQEGLKYYVFVQKRHEHQESAAVLINGQNHPSSSLESWAMDSKHLPILLFFRLQTEAN